MKSLKQQRIVRNTKQNDDSYESRTLNNTRNGFNCKSGKTCFIHSIISFLRSFFAQSSIANATNEEQRCASLENLNRQRIHVVFFGAACVHSVWYSINISFGSNSDSISLLSVTAFRKSNPTMPTIFNLSARFQPFAI